MSIPTQVTIRPNYRDEPVFGVRTPGDTDSFAEGGPTLEQAINPLHYIPFVSQVYEAISGNEGSSALKVIGGAILGGPVGFVAGIASAIFEQEAGHSVGMAIANAFSGEEAPVQVASAEKTTTQQAVPTPAVQEILPPEKTAALSASQATTIAQEAQMKMASAITDIGAASNEDSAVLSLFGGQPSSAHRSYQKAQMLPYLRDVNTSMVM